MQEKILNDAFVADSNDSMYMNKSINVYDILELINPQIENWNCFEKDYEKLVTPIIRKLKNDVKIKRNMNIPNEIEKFNNAEIFLRNFLVFMNMKQIFEKMSPEEIDEFCVEKLEKNEIFEV